MHAAENIDVYIFLSTSVATGGKHGKRQVEVAIGFFTVLRGVGVKGGNSA